MIHLLQRMDDSEPRHPVAGTPHSVAHAPPSLTLLADADESEVQALEDWTRGLDWVEWLFSSVRQRQVHLHFQPACKDELLKLRLAWEGFTHGLLEEVCVPHLLQAWQAALSNDAAALVAADRAFSSSLSISQRQASQDAGRILLKGTRGARYQCVLGHYRLAVEAEEAPGHFLTVWAALGHFFQLGLTNVIAEYLRLEWSQATRNFAVRPALENLPRLTARLMQSRPQELRVVA